ncbi:M3 family metallopeptidase [Saccharothrix xinjiangensis]|uniref:M3 family metallopeptidase n=1 Tax=Saccharothrix xinjiangensis TaxID=204798 RepID=A0ABV9XTE3_9PSEU
MTTDLSGTNPLADPTTWPSGWPPLHLVADHHVEPAVRAAVEARAAALAAVRDSPALPTFDDVQAIELAHDRLWPIRQAWSVLLKTRSTDARRAVDAVVAPLLADADAAAWLDSALAARVADVHGRRHELGLEHEDLHLVERLHRRFRRAGAHLDPPGRDRLHALTVREAELETAIEARLTSGQDAAAVHVTDPAELAGLDEVDLARAAEAAAEHGLPGWLLTLTGATVQPVLAHLEDADLRRRVHHASTDRCSRGDAHDTRALVVELLRIRAERAGLLGYAHHADYVLDVQTAGTVGAVRTLLHELAPHAVRLVAAEDAALGAGGPVAPWDRPRLAHQAHHPGDGTAEVDVRDYLSLNTVLDGVCNTLVDLFDLRFRPRPDLTPPVPDAWVWEAVDDDGQYLGLVLVDPHRRPGKRAGAWTTELVAQSRLLRRRGAVALCLNLPRPDARLHGDVLLTPDQAVQVWHEMGHVAHAMLSDVHYPGDAGHARLPRDVVEVPAVVQEMWALDPDVLRDYARHHTTREPIPADLADRLGGARHGTGYRLHEDVAASLVDLALHSLTPDQVPEATCLEEHAQRVLADAGLADGVPLRYPVPIFRHIWVGGYDARYYAYTWSDVLSARIHARLGDIGTAGDRLRAVLARGSAEPELYLELAGGRPDPDALLARLGARSPDPDAARWIAATADAADRLLHPGTARLPVPPLQPPALPFADRGGAARWLTANADALTQAQQDAAAAGLHETVMLLAGAARHLTRGPRAGWTARLDAETRGITAARAAGSREAEAYLLIRRSETHRLLDNTEHTSTDLWSALALADVLGDDTRRREAVGGLSLLYRSLGDLGRAREYARRQLDMARRSGDPLPEAIAECALGQLAAEAGGYTDAVRHAERQMELRELAGDPVGTAYARHDLAVARQGLGEHDAASELCGQAVAAYRVYGGTDALRAEALETWARSLDHLGATKKAAECRAEAAGLVEHLC